MSDFESDLAKTPLRGAPAEWRGEILRAAHALSAEPALPTWWRCWLAPQPLTLTAAWIIIILLQVATPKESAAPCMTSLSQIQAEIRAQQKLLAELLPPPAPAAPPGQQGAALARRKHQPA